jgi:nitroreductase
MADILQAEHRTEAASPAIPAAGLKSRVLPRIRRLRNAWRCLVNCLAHCRRFVRHSNLGGPVRDASEYAASLTRSYHCIEKGLSLPSPRPLFGQRAIADIVLTLKECSPRFGFGQAGRAAVNALSEYVAFHERAGISDPYLDWLRSALEGFKSSPAFGECAEAEGGSEIVRREDVLRDGRVEFGKFVRSRHSVRQFSREPVDVALIREAVAMAQATPSVCNRQPWRACLLTRPEDIRRVLNIQNGNRGFSEEVDKLLVVVSEQAAFLSSGEVFQGWVDSGMFAMSLVYALHSLGLGTCCLNWSVDWFEDARLRRELKVREGEIIVLMIAVGNLLDEFRVCQSPRKAVDDVLEVRE